MSTFNLSFIFIFIMFTWLTQVLSDMEYENTGHWKRIVDSSIGAAHFQLRSIIKSTSGNLIDIDDFMQRCYEDFGCYSIAYPWNAINRPVNLFPLPPDQINPMFCLYTTRNLYDCDLLDLNNVSTIYTSNYIPGGRVYLIVHGFVESGDRPWIKEMTQALIERSSKSNVIVVDWAGGSSPPYTQAVANIRLVGVMTAHLILMLQREVVGLQTEKIHIIGHSLGAHLASYVGTTLRRSFGMRLGRITGLDPAEPHFGGTDPIVRLDPTDAIYVDVIHTDGSTFIMGGLGIIAPVGHVDFYPNGGKDQPGCNHDLKGHMHREDGSFIKGFRRWLNCNHIKCYQYFTETIKNGHDFMGVQCQSYGHYLNGTCFKCSHSALKDGTYEAPTCIPMGFNSPRAFFKRFKHNSGSDIMFKESPKTRYQTMFLITDESKPFYKCQYRVAIKISPEGREVGKFHIKIVGVEGETSFLPLDFRVSYFEPDSINSVVVGGEHVGNIKGAIIQWSYQTSWINPLTWRLNRASISLDYVTVESLENSNVKLCTPNKAPLQSGASTMLHNCL